MPSSLRPLHAAALAASLLAGCAHGPAPVAARDEAAEPPPALTTLTGSRIPRRGDPATGKVIPFTAVRTYGRADLLRTGMPDLATQLPVAVSSPP